MKSLSMLACSILLAAGGLFLLQGSQSQTTLAADAQSDQVEVKTDRYSEATTVKLKPQLILDTPDHFITMRLEAKFGEKKIRSEMEMANAIMTESAMIWFESQSKTPTDFGDRELHFIIDNKRLKIGESTSNLFRSSLPDPDLKPGFKFLKKFANSLDTDQLKQIAAGNQVQMRLGKFEFALNSSVLGYWREFVSEFTKHALSTRQKERRQ
jgi:hypothetical protein